MISNDTFNLKISKDFTIDDIHKIREWNYERMKQASHDEIIAYYKNVSEAAEAERKSLRQKRPRQVEYA